jgi:hypothetical protein
LRWRKNKKPEEEERKEGEGEEGEEEEKRRRWIDEKNEKQKTKKKLQKGTCKGRLDCYSGHRVSYNRVEKFTRKRRKDNQYIFYFYLL